MRYATILATAVAVSVFSSPASALVRNYVFTLDGTQAATGSPGTGQVTVNLNDVTGAITVNGTYSGMLGTRTDQHIHGPAGPGVNAPVFFPLSGVGGNSGTISGAGTLTAAQIGFITSGNAYVNIHSTSVAAGEIRGQVVPEPGSLALIGVGLAAIARRSRR